MVEEPFVAVRLVVDAPERLGITYAIAGSLGGSVYGHPRTTNDADVVAHARPAHVAPLLASLEREFYVPTEAAAEAVGRGGSFNVIHLDTAFKVDIFVGAGNAFHASQLSRRRLETIEQHALYLISPEDSVLAKLRWYRGGGEESERQWRDVLGVIQVQGERLDRAYLNEAAQALGVTDLLERALALGAP